MDLSFPHGSSINDFIPKDDYTLHYASFDEALTLVAHYGQKALMAKLDIKHAFHLCPVRLEDRELLGIHWQGKFEWILKNNYRIQDLMHYLDDYFTVGPAHSSICAHNVKTILHVASQVGIPLAPNKLEGPTTRLVFLGILIDTNSMETSLPDDKLHELISELQSWSTRNKCLKRELLSLIGKLNFACRIIPAGRIFLRHLIDLSTSARLPHHHVTMNREVRRDIAWWLRFLASWNGRAIIPDPHWTKSPDLELFTDASGSLGYGIFYSLGYGIFDLRDQSIQWQELYPIALACLLWGISGQERSSSSTATTKQQWIFGLLALPGTSLLCILFIPYSLTPLPTTTQFSSLILLALITLLLIPCLVSRYLGSITSPQQQTFTQPRFQRERRLFGTPPSLPPVHLY